MYRRFVNQPTFQGGNGSAQSIDITFPYPEDVDAYKITTNGTKWDLYGANVVGSYTKIDSREYQQTLKPYYTLPSTATYSNFKIEVSQVGAGSNALYVSNLILTNKYYQVLYPNLNQTTNTYTTVISGPTPLTFPNINVSTVSETTAVNSVNQIGYTSYIQSNIYANVSCAYFNFTPTTITDYRLVGSMNGGLSWSNIIASNTNVSGNTTMFNSFRLLGNANAIFTDLNIYDTSGNLVNKPGSVGGLYRGYESNTNGIYGEWLEINFDTPVSANVYEFSSDKMHPSSWYIVGSSDRSNWYVLDRKSNIYETTRITSPLHSNLAPYKIYRMVITSTFDGSGQGQNNRDKSAARVYDFGLYDNKGLQLVPRSNNTPTSNTYQEILPTSVLKPVGTIPETSPFYDGVEYTSNDRNDTFYIDMYVPVSVYKIYMENTNGFDVYGSYIVDQQKTLVLRASPAVSNTYTTANNSPFRYFHFTNIAPNAKVSNPMLFGLNGRLNPYLTTTSTSNVYGGYALTSEFVEIRYPETIIDSYSFFATNQPSNWTIYNYDQSGTRSQLVNVSNIYTPFSYYQADLTPIVSTGLRLTVDELAPSKTPSSNLIINGFNAYSNNSPVTPYMTSNTLNLTSKRPVVSSQQGVFRFSATASDFSNNVSALFDYSDATIFSYTSSRQSQLSLDDSTLLIGDWVHVEIPIKTAIRYYTITPSSRLTPKSWKLVGSVDSGDYNWTLLSTVSSFTGTTTTRFVPENTTKACKYFRLVFTVDKLELAEFALYNNARIIPKITGTVSSWETYKNRSGDQYGGYYRGSASSNGIPGEWIQIGFDPTLLVSPSSIFIESNQLPSNIIVLTSNTSINMSANVSVAAQIVNFSNQTQITIPITRRDSRYYRIIANDIYNSNGFSVSNIFVLNDRGERLYRFFSTDGTQQPYPPSAMTSTPITIGGITYTATVSSLASGSVINAYNKNVQNGYTSGGNLYNATTGAYIGALTTGTIGGEYTTLQLSSPTAFQRYDLSVMTIHFARRAPATVYLFGSIDGTSWNQLHTVSGLTWTTNTKTFTFNNSTAYSYYRVVVNAIVQNIYNETNMLISDITYYTVTGTTQIDGVNASTIISDNGVFGGLFNGSKDPQYVLANVQSAITSNGYIFKSDTARTWNVYASTDNTNWTLLDSRVNDKKRQNFQIFYYQNQTGQAYKYFKAQINETFPTTDGSVSVGDFSILDSNQNKMFNRIINSSGETANIYVGGDRTTFAFLKDTAGNIYFGEYKTYQFNKPVIVSNVTVSCDTTTLIKDIVFLGCNTESSWTNIPIVGGGVDIVKPGTYSFYKSNVVSSASNAFNETAFCILGSYEDITNKPIPSLTFMFPYPTRVAEIHLTFPTTEEFKTKYLPIAEQFKPYLFTLYGSYDNKTWTTLKEFDVDIRENSFIGGVNDQSPFLYFKLEFKKFSTSVGTALYDAAIIKNLMFKYGGSNLYTPSMFTTSDGDTQIVEQSQYMKRPFEFIKPVEYSNIAFIINNTTSEPYISDGRLKINNVQFSPNPFPDVNANYSEYYDYKPTEIVPTSADQSIILKSSNRFFPTGYSFESNTANVWSFYTSDDGNVWSAVDSSVSGSKMRPIKVPLGAQFFKLSVEKITNLVDGTVDISNVSVFSASSYIPPIPMKSNNLIYETLLQADSYSINNAVLRVVNDNIALT
jgi:hypothetical protein